MIPEIDYLRPKIIGVLSQLNADNGKKNIQKLCDQAEGILAAREAVGEKPKRENVSALVTQIHGAVQAHNAQNDIDVESVSDIMDGFDAAANPG